MSVKFGIAARAVNENPIIEMLLEKYSDLLSNKMGISNISIFSLYDHHWECLMAEGACKDMNGQIDIDAELSAMKDITYVNEIEDKQLKAKMEKFGIGVIIPVISRQTPIAYLLIGSSNAERKEPVEIDPVVINILIQSISDLIIVCIESLRLITENLRQAAVKKELELAAHVQNRLIPRLSELPRNRHIIMNAFYKPHYEVGGDYFDCIELGDNKIGFCIADVSGKGMAASLLMSNFQATLRALFTADIPMDGLVRKLNERVLANTQGHDFITLFITRYDCATHQMEYVNCGHTTSILYAIDSKRLQLLSCSCQGLGMLDVLPPFETGMATITEHSLMLNYTDGLVELLSENGDVQSAFDTILQLLHNSSTIDEAVETIVEKQKLNQSNYLIFDDVTLLGVEFL